MSHRRRALLAALVAGCGGGQGTISGEVSLDRPVPPEPAALDQAAVASVFARARARLWTGDAPPAPAIAVGRIILCAYGPWPGGHCTAGTGDDLAAATDAAADRLATDHDSELAAAGPDAVRLKLDAITMTRRGPLTDGIPIEELGLVGLVVGQSFLTPSELLELDLAGERSGYLRLHRVEAALARRGPRPALEPSTAVDWFYSASWVERAPAAAPVRLYRAHLHDNPEPTADLLLRRSVWAADYLARITDAEGEIRYHYEVARDRDKDDYNLLRHAGSIYALVSAYERTGDDRYRSAGERALAYLMRRTETDSRRGPHGGGEVRLLISPRSTGPVVKLGGVGLMLLALDQWMQATGDRSRLAVARQLARFLVYAQKEDGELRSYLPVHPGQEVPDRVSLYYPGEAILALVRLYELDPDRDWLAAAKRGADWLIDVRDAGKTPDELANDHWLMIGLSHLYRQTGDRRYVDHSIALAKSLLPNYRKGLAIGARYRDYRGGFYVPPRSTPAATRAEGLVAVLDTCRLADVDCAWVMELLLDTARHQLLAQYTPEILYWVPRPELVHGAFMGGVTDTSVRNDFVQHNLSALLGLERQLRAGTGTTVPGGPTWHGSQHQQAWQPPAAAVLQQLRGD